MRRYIMQDASGAYHRLETADDDTITFGPTIPFTPRGGPGMHHGPGYAVRVWTGARRGVKARLRGVFSGMVSVREEGLVLETIPPNVEEFPRVTEEAATKRRRHTTYTGSVDLAGDVADKF